jgi:hypothetical protein
MLERWAKKLNSITFIDHFEGLIVEHVPIYVGRQLDLKFRSIGYIPNATIPSAWLAYHFLQTTWESRVMPDVIVVSGQLMKETLIRQGVPSCRIKIGPDLRQNFAPKPVGVGKSRTDIVLLLSLAITTAVEMLRSVATHSGWIREYLEASVIVKNHPMVKSSKLLKSAGWSELPSGCVSSPNR